MGNPLNAEAGMLRPSLLPGTVSMLQLNSTRDVRAVRLFEYGTVFNGSTAQVNESASLALVALRRCSSHPHDHGGGRAVL